MWNLSIATITVLALGALLALGAGFYRRYLHARARGIHVENLPAAETYESRVADKTTAQLPEESRQLQQAVRTQFARETIAENTCYACGLLALGFAVLVGVATLVPAWAFPLVTLAAILFLPLPFALPISTGCRVAAWIERKRLLRRAVRDGIDVHDPAGKATPST